MHRGLLFALVPDQPTDPNETLMGVVLNKDRKACGMTHVANYLAWRFDTNGEMFFKDMITVSHTYYALFICAHV